MRYKVNKQKYKNAQKAPLKFMDKIVIGTLCSIPLFFLLLALLEIVFQLDTKPYITAFATTASAELAFTSGIKGVKTSRSISSDINSYVETEDQG